MQRDGYSVGDWSVYPAEGLLVRRGEQKHLRPKAMDLLSLLASSPGRTVSRETILGTVWADSLVEEGGLSRCVSELRATLEDDARQPRYLETIPRRGYRLIARVGPLEVAEGRRDHRRWLAAAGAGILIIALAATVYAVYSSRLQGPRGPGAAEVLPTAGARRSPEDRSSGEGAAHPAAGRSLVRTPGTAPSGRRAAVLAIANLSGDAEEDWLGGAFAHLLTAELAMTTDLRLIPEAVAGRAEADLPVRDPSSAPAVVSRLRGSLAIDYLVSGHYLVAGEDGSREVTLDLVVTDTASGEIVAAAVETGAADQLAQIVTLAALRLRESLGLPTPSGEPAEGQPRRLAEGLPPAYFRGLLHLERFEAAAARSDLERAVEEAPDAPWPRLALAEAWSLQGYDRRAGEALEEALRRAGGLEREDRLWFEARAHALAARWDAAIERLQALWLLDPANLEYGLELASTLLAAGRAEETATLVDELPARAPPGYQDPRIALARGEAALALSDAAGALEAAKAAGDQARALSAPLVEGRALHLEARALRDAGQAAEARTALAAARQRFALARDRPREAAAALTLSGWLTEAGDFAGGEREARAALEISRGIGDRAGEARGLRAYGFPIWEQGRRADGEKAVRESLAISREIGDRSGEAATLGSLGIGLASLGRSLGTKDRATSCFKAALDIYRDLGQRERMCAMLINLGRASMLEGDPLGAIEAFDEAAGMVDVLAADNRAGVLFNLGWARTLIGDVPGARGSFQEACELFRQLENRRMLAAALEGLGEARLLAAEIEPALADLRESLRLRRELGDPKRTILGQAALAGALLEAGQPEAAERLARAALAQVDSRSPFDTRQTAEFALARILLASGRAEAALAMLDDPRPVPLDSPPTNVLDRSITYGRLLAAVGRSAEAEELLRAIRGFVAKRGIESLRLEADVALLELARTRGDGLDLGRVAEVARQARKRGMVLLAKKAEDLAPPGV